ncbi:hypothetical protein [Aquabacter spiritensis]|uniref:Hpr(Ser) kinase/phosphatase n=1 Tax=Aquabacter spiritensis TaxID=933073 RepID=A0A4R3LUC4_9HYPH|nr:hypothetical protein [Aquabacter spiritensis]TCT04200.1 Hpr(Ser) kinase/phosphatase [Aquabacter spiritensis]
MDYRAFGLSFGSDIALPELCAGAEAGRPRIAIRHAPTFDGALPSGLAATPDLFDLTIADLARFRILGDARIEVESVPQAPPTDIRAYLLGSVMAALLYKRGLLPLHASAVLAPCGVIAFAGRSGAGKSTLAHLLAERGYPVIADDLLGVEAGAEGPVCWTAIPRLKLWDTSVAFAGLAAERFEPVLHGADKFHVPARNPAPHAPHRLAALYLLEEPAPDGPAPLAPAHAIAALIANSQRPGYAGPLGCGPAHFATCVAIGRTLPVFACGRLWGLAHLGDEIDRLERHFTRLPVAQASPPAARPAL